MKISKQAIDMRRILITMTMLLAVISMNGQTKTITRQSTSKKTEKVTQSTPKSNKNQTKTKSQGKQNTQMNQSHKGHQTSQPRQSRSLCPDNNHPHAIDLVLPSGTKWACCNVGAKKPEDYGGYYAWGETEMKSIYNWKTYIHCEGTEITCHELGTSINDTNYDVAHVKWGGSWQMPTYEEIKELIEHCTYAWTTINNVEGGKFTSNKNGRSIFLPAAGLRWYGDLFRIDSYGNYWSSTLFSKNSANAYYLYFDSDNTNWFSYYRSRGHSVRPVTK